MNFNRDFSPKTIKQLNRKGIEITGKQAIPAYESDKYCTGECYILVWNEEVQFLRNHDQIVVLACSSWNPATDLELA